MMTVSRKIPRPSPHGITLIEVLISMFVLLFGLMGVAAIFPVASHYIVEGEKRERGGGLAQIAFEEIKSRKLLRPKEWIYGNNSYGLLMPPTDMFSEFLPVYPQPADDGVGPGHAFVIDPLGSAKTPNNFFPLDAAGDNHWLNSNASPSYFAGGLWPVRRLTLDLNADPTIQVPMDFRTAETEFRLRDDLSVEQPDAGDRPSVQRWSVDNNGTPNIFTDDTMLARQYKGEYSWLATVVPIRERALIGLQPAANIKDEFYEVSAVVFYKRDEVPSFTEAGSPGSERLIEAEFLNSGELVLFSSNPTARLARQDVDLATDKIKPTNWIAVMGVHPTTGVFLMKWYKILAIDEETSLVDLNTGGVEAEQGRYVMVDGPEWPEVRTSAGPTGWVNLRVAILPGVIDVYTRVMQIEQQ